MHDLNIIKAQNAAADAERAVKVEKVAKAIFDAENGVITEDVTSVLLADTLGIDTLTEWADLPNNEFKETYRTQARAAIAAFTGEN